jgi:riboflavin synthase
VFTGLVDDIGVIGQISQTDAGREFRVQCRYDDLLDGESIALNGACLTVREHGPHWFTVAAVSTTLERTTIGDWHQGQRVNLERALRPMDRLGGHIVQGHVDGVGTILSTHRHGDAWLIEVRVPDDVSALLVPHGSICVDGISLTVNAVPEPGVLGLSIIEYTLLHTTLADRVRGDRVHIESDVIGKFVRQLMHPYLSASATASGATLSPQVLGTAMSMFRSLGN